LSDPRVVKLAQQQMREMIEQAGNHPSIFAWSVCNESATSTPGGRRYVQTMKQFIRELDPDRYVSFADDSIAYADPAQNASQDADFVMMNQYFGSWHGPASLLPQVLDKVGRSYPDKMFIISEFGLAGVHAPNAKVADERRIKIIRDQMAEFAKRDWIAGALLWCYQDYKSHRNLWPGQTEGYVDHGVVDEWRQRRPSYYVWQKENEPARIALEWTYKGYNFSEPVGFHATISARPETEIPSYTLHGYKAHWELRDDEGNLVAHGDRVLQQANGTDAIGASFNMPKTKSLSLKITVSRPIGFMAAEESLNWWRVNPGGQNVEQMNLGGEKLPPK
jgi:beta-glucuronidase